MRPPSLLACLVLLLAAPAAAQNSIERGNLVVHYNALASTEITPEVARQYAITRSAGRGLLNVAVLRKVADGTQQAVAAKVEASATNLAGQRQSLALREVREGDAIYYLAEPRVDQGERLTFELSVLPEGESTPILARFAQEFFAAPVR
jgi:hypothetical protein